MQTAQRGHWKRSAHASEHMDSQSERRPSSAWPWRGQQGLVRSRLQATDAVIDKAFFMCYGRPDAVKPTHTVITATLRVPLSGTGPITFPPETKTRTRTSGKTSIPTAIPRETGSSQSLPTTLVTDPTSLSSPRPSITRSTTKPTTKPPFATSKSPTTSPAEILTTDPVAPTFTGASTSATETSTSTNVPDGIFGGQGEKKASASLSTGQVAGIAIGCITGVGFIGFGIAVFCRCLRKRRSRFGRKMRKGGRPLRDSWNSGAEKGPHGGGGTDSWIANQLRAPLDPGPMPVPTKSWYNRASWRPSAIGLAISPGNTRDATRATTPTSARPLSKLLPAKPVMNQGPPRLEVSLPSRDGDSHFGAAAIIGAAAASAAAGAVMSGAIAKSSSPKPKAQAKAYPITQPMARPAIREPKIPEPSIRPRNLTPPGKPQPPSPLRLIIPKTGNFKPFIPAVTRHDSSTTEFEEDGRSSLSPGGQIWRPPSADPHTAAPYYVADRSGNWRLGDPARALEIAELEASISPLTAAPKSAAPKLVAGLGLATGAAGALALVKAASQRRENRAVEASKAAEQSRQSALGITMPPEQTIRAVEPSLSSDEEIQEQEQQPYAPRPLFSGNGNSSNFPRRSSTHRRSSTRSLTRPRIKSTDSGVTNISTSTDDTDLRSPLEQPGNLSPVVESPRSLRPGRGRSPTQYPKIPASLNAAVPSPGNLNSDVAAAKGGAVTTGYSKPTAMGDRPAQPSPSFGAPLAAGTMSSDGNMPRQQGKKFMGPRAVESPGAVRTGSPMMRAEASMSRPDERYYQRPRSQVLQQAGPSSQPGPSSRPYPQQQLQQQQQYPAPAYQRPPSNNYSIPYRLPPHPTAYRPNIDSSGYPYQTRLPEFNQGPATYNLPYPPQQNRYPHHHPRNHQPPFVQQPSARPVSQLPQQRQQPNQRPQQPQPQQQQQQQRRQQPQNLHLQPPTSSSYYPEALPPPLLTGNSTTTTTSAHSADSSSSSLLAKRLGTSRAANMAIPVPQPNDPYASSTQNKWLRQGQGQGQAELSSPRMPPPPQEPTELPATPVWKPRLTPTRRGDDLFLIAQ
ncbi:hypothetical protein V8C42DRAFT_341534 [Trichoderma barbatum]